MAPQMKRPAAKVAQSPKAKKQQQDPFTKKCNAIISVLHAAEGYPESTIQMLEVGVKACLSEPKDSRHGVQNSVIEMISEVVNSVEAGHASKLEALRAKIAEADAEKATREAAAEATAAVQKEKAEAVEAAEQALSEANKATAERKEEKKAAVSAQESGDSDLLMADARKAAAEGVVSEHLVPLKDGTAADSKKSVKTLAQVAKELGLEAQLIQSADLVLRKAPAERGAFDGMVTQQVEEQFQTTIAKLADLLANGEAGKEERATKVEACTTQVDAAILHGEACQERLRVAKSELKEAEAGKKAAAKAVKDFGPEMAEAAANAEAANAVLVACQADLATFKELVEGAPAAPEEAAAEEAAPAADVEEAPAAPAEE